MISKTTRLNPLIGIILDLENCLGAARLYIP